LGDGATVERLDPAQHGKCRPGARDSAGACVIVLDKEPVNGQKLRSTGGPKAGALPTRLQRGHDRRHAHGGHRTRKFDHLTEYLKTAAVGGRVLDQVPRHRMPRHAIMGMIGPGANESRRDVIAQRGRILPS
jgi:hypothetical protein